MKNIVEYNKIIYKNNINIFFYLYCLLKDFKLIRFMFTNLFNATISFLFTSKKELYEKNKFKYLKYVKNIDKKIEEFYKNKKIDYYYDIKKDVVIAKTPKVLLHNNIKEKIISYDLDENYNVDIKKFKKEIGNLTNINCLYASSFDLLKNVNAKKKYYTNKRFMFLIKKTINIPNWIKICLSVLLLSALLTSISFSFALTNLDLSFIKTYFETKLFVLNFLPIFTLIILLLFITKRIHISYLITSLIILCLGIANQTKLLYRDDIVKFEDLFLIKEAKIMAERYEILIKPATILAIILTIFLFFLIKHYVKKIKVNKYVQIPILIIIIISMIFGYKTIYNDEELYNSVGDTSIINIWITTRQYQIRGLVYPFIYTMKEINDVPPENYNENEVAKILNTYEYKNIPEDKKVNIIAIMLEAYNDFSKFDVIDFEKDIYKKFHEIQEQSISGTLVTSIFGGGTIETERNFLTGYYIHPTYRKNTNSYVWYFKEQGYKTEANHPIYGAFYNRKSVNINLGFDNYYHYENRYLSIQEDFVNDYVFFDDIINSYEQAKKEQKPYFNFSVTYQNHGPYYSGTYAGKEYYFEDKNMSEEGYNTLNEYLYGISQTTDALYRFIKYFEKDEEPTIIVIFGDHNPYLGENGLVYNELGINIDASNINGFLNYYETPYIIYGNNSAKEMFNKPFKGKGKRISPIFLMNEIFNYIGFEGNEYLQYMNDLKQQIPIINPVYIKVGEEYIQKNKENDLIKEYELVNYYVSRNFVTKNTE